MIRFCEGIPASYDSAFGQLQATANFTTAPGFCADIKITTVRYEHAYLVCIFLSILDSPLAVCGRDSFLLVVSNPDTRLVQERAPLHYERARSIFLEHIFISFLTYRPDVVAGHIVGDGVSFNADEGIVLDGLLACVRFTQQMISVYHTPHL